MAKYLSKYTVTELQEAFELIPQKRKKKMVIASTGGKF